LLFSDQRSISLRYGISAFAEAIMFRSIMLSMITVLMAVPATAQQTGNWYYCDTSKAYYPYVTSCSVPWRQVAPISSTPSPARRPEPIQGSPPNLNPPEFCNKPGFGLSTSGLTPDQRRQCYDAIHAAMHEPVGDPADRAQEDAAAQSAVPPPYCKPGFGLVDSGLTGEQRRICEATLVPEVERVGTCEGSPGACREFQKQQEAQREADRKAGYCRFTDPAWRDCLGPSVTVEADNGQIFRAFTAKGISGRSNLGVELLVYFEQQPNAPYYPPNLHRFVFDCKGDYMDIATPNANLQYAPPRSVAGKLSAIACSLP
jgi:hypothetical protein